jgi:hypothetical protein
MDFNGIKRALGDVAEACGLNGYYSGIPNSYADTLDTDPKRIAALLQKED